MPANKPLKRVLIITYYWPPSAGSGVQRWLKTVKYLRQYGYEPVVYTVSNSQFELRDEALLSEVPNGVEVIRQPIWEPFDLYNRFMGAKQKATNNVNPLYAAKQGKGLKARLAIWVRSNLFIPDTRMFFISPSVKYLTQYLKTNPVEVMVTTGPPHSMHVIGLGVKRALKKQGVNLPWLADFRDPWTQIGFYKELNLSGFARHKHERLEYAVLTESDSVVAVSHAMAEDMDTLAPIKTQVVHNGYDEADFQFTGPAQASNSFTISYVGMLGFPRNHQVFWKALADLTATNEAFAKHLRIDFYGKIDPVVQASAEEFGLSNWLSFKPYMPHHEILEVQRSSAVLLLMIDNVNNSKGILTGKIFEYLALQRPILCIGPEGGDAQAVIQETQSGYFSDYHDLETLKQNLMTLFTGWITNTPVTSPSGYEKFSRRVLAGKFASLLNQLIDKAKA